MPFHQRTLVPVLSSPEPKPLEAVEGGTPVRKLKSTSRNLGSLTADGTPTPYSTQLGSSPCFPKAISEDPLSNLQHRTAHPNPWGLSALSNINSLLRLKPVWLSG